MSQPNNQSSRHWAASPRSRARENARNTLCRNIVIYGHCRHEKDGCIYNHDKPGSTPRLQETAAKQRLTVDSPSFTPTEPAVPSKTNNTLSPQAASAAIFTPGGPESLPSTTSSDYDLTRPTASGFAEFVPRSYQQSPAAAFVDPVPQSEMAPGHTLADPFTSYDGASNFMNMGSSVTTGQVNPYAADSANEAAAAFYQQQQAAFQQPLQYHLYAPLGPHRENLLAYQRATHNFFIPENLRQELQRQNEATMQVLPSLSLPASIEHYHSLVPLDTTHSKTNPLFGYPSWTYKAVSSKDGLAYVIRRLEGFRLTNEKAIYSKQTWRRIDCASVATVHDCFTTRAFGDSSLVFVTDYHPLSKTLAEHHLPSHFNRRPQAGPVSEQVLWSYAVQIASALKAIHANGLAARVINSSKVIISGKNRIRLAACGILDVIKFEDQTPLAALQLEDFRQLGQLLFTLATMNTTTIVNLKTTEGLGRTHGENFKRFVLALADPTQTQDSINDITTLMSWLSEHAFTTLDQSFHVEDTIMTTLNQELENGRLFRLIAKLGCINERPEYQENSSTWAETGERYYLKLFRDYVFHQVGPQGTPVVDLGHIVMTLNKLDAGSEEKITLMSRDESNIFVVSYKELKRALENSFLELLQASRRA